MGRAARSIPLVLFAAAAVLTSGTASALFGDAPTVGANTVSTATLLPPPDAEAEEQCTGSAGTGVEAVVTWDPSPSSFNSGHRVQRWRNGVLEREQNVTPGTVDTVTDGPLQEGVTYEFRIAATYENWTSTDVVRFLTPACAADATLLWSRNGVTAPQTTRMATWYPSTQATASVGRWRHLEAARSSTRDEVIAVGVRTDGAVTAEMRSNGTWSALAANPLATGRPARQVADVAYESVSGDAMLVWANGNNGTQGLSYRVWNGATWSPTATITTPLSGTPARIRLASSPVADEMLLGVSDASNDDYVLVWNGSQWDLGDSVDLAGSGVGSGNDVSVAYESLSGDGLVTYRQGTGADAEALRYRVWNGSWGPQQSLPDPAGGSSQPEWTELAAAPDTDQIAAGVITDSDEAWVAVWTGSAWVNTSLVTTNISTVDGPAIALAFESLSGKALVAYGLAGTNSFGFRSWTSGSGWGPQGTVLAFGGDPHALTADARPGTDDIIIGAQDTTSSLTYLNRTGGGTWTVTTNPRLEPDTGEVDNKPFALIWE